MAAGLQRSEVSFRRQGSSGFVWDDKFLSGELNQLPNPKQENNSKSNQNQAHENKEDPAVVAVAAENSARVPDLKIERSRSNGGGRGFRTGKVSPAIEPPSPKVSACGFCSAFGKNDKTRRRPPRRGKRVM